MIRLPDRPLPQAALQKLASYQQEIDALPDYAERVERAKTSWKSHNRKGNAAFDTVKTTLTAMCCGARRCVYCEDSAAGEVEHIRPKDLYPDAAFLWSNYLYACGPCNGPKNSQFAVFATGTGVLTEVSRHKDEEVVPPAAGNPVLLDPRAENPCDILTLDLQDTFYFVPLARRGTVEYERADYTIRVLGLNARDYLPIARREAYNDYKAHLTQYRALRDQGEPPERLARLVETLRRRQHPTVWFEMKRQHDKLPELSDLFRAVPDALDW